MALDTNATKIANLIDPEVLADYVEGKLIDAIKFSPLAKINYDLEGKGYGPGGFTTFAINNEGNYYDIGAIVQGKMQ